MFKTQLGLITTLRCNYSEGSVSKVITLTDAYLLCCGHSLSLLLSPLYFDPHHVTCTGDILSWMFLDLMKQMNRRVVFYFMDTKKSEKMNKSLSVYNADARLVIALFDRLGNDRENRQIGLACKRHAPHRMNSQSTI